MKAPLQFIGVCNDKGGVGKSLVAALVAEQLGSDIPTTVAEIEQRAAFTQELYPRSATVAFRPILLLSQDTSTGRHLPSLQPLGALRELVPAEEGGGARLIVDFGASTCQSFLFWARDDRGLQPFRDRQFAFTFFIPVLGADPESADFFNANAPSLMRLGAVVAVRNHIHGADFSHLEPEVLAKTQVIDLPFRGRPLIDEIATKGRRLTFRQLAERTDASRRARLDARACDQIFSEQFATLRRTIGI